MGRKLACVEQLARVWLDCYIQDNAPFPDPVVAVSKTPIFVCGRSCTSLTPVEDR